MALTPYNYYTPPSFSSFNQHAFIESLNNAHMVHNNHKDIVKKLIYIVRDNAQLVSTYAIQVSNYLKTNLQQNIQIIDSLQCLCLVHEKLMIFSKRIISLLLNSKYNPQTNYYHQMKQLQSINTNLVQPFIRLISLITKWFNLHIQENNYNHIEVYEIQYVLNYALSISRYQYETDLAIEGEMNEYILVIYRILVQDMHENQIISTSPVYCRMISHILYYFLANLSIIDNAEESNIKVIQYSFKQIMQMISNSLDVEGEMVNLLLSRVRTTIIKHNSEQNLIKTMQMTSQLIVNLLLIDWSLQRQYFWLRTYHTIGDLMNLPLSEQVSEMKQIKQIVKELGKLFKT